MAGGASREAAGRCSGGAKGSRTPDLLNAIQALSQLSYGPDRARAAYSAGLEADQGAPPQPGCWGGAEAAVGRGVGKLGLVGPEHLRDPLRFARHRQRQRQQDARLLRIRLSAIRKPARRSRLPRNVRPLPARVRLHHHDALARPPRSAPRSRPAVRSPARSRRRRSLGARRDEGAHRGAVAAGIGIGDIDPRQRVERADVELGVRQQRRSGRR